MIVLDASVMISFVDARDRHHEAALDLLRSNASERLATSSLTLAEALVHPAQFGIADQEHEFLVALELIVYAVEATDAVPLAELRATHGMRLPDSVVLNTAIQRKAVLATFDARLARAAREAGIETLGAD